MSKNRFISEKTSFNFVTQIKTYQQSTKIACLNLLKTKVAWFHKNSICVSSFYVGAYFNHYYSDENNQTKRL